MLIVNQEKVFELICPVVRYRVLDLTVRQMSAALLVASYPIVAIWLRQEIRPSPKLTITIRESVQLAWLVLAELER